MKYKPNDEIMDEKGHVYIITNIEYPNYTAIDREGKKYALPIKETDWLCHISTEDPIYVVIDNSVHSIMKVFHRKIDAEEYKRIFGGTIQQHYVI